MQPEKQVLNSTPAAPRRRRKRPALTQRKRNSNVKKELFYPIKGILKERLNAKGTLEYLIDWAGIDEKTGGKWKPTWEPSSNATPEAIKVWNEDKAARASAKDKVPANRGQAESAALDGLNDNDGCGDAVGDPSQAPRSAAKKTDSNRGSATDVERLRPQNAETSQEIRRLSAAATTGKEAQGEAASKTQLLTTVTKLMLLANGTSVDQLQERHVFDLVASGLLEGDTGLIEEARLLLKELEDFLKKLLDGET